MIYVETPLRRLRRLWRIGAGALLLVGGFVLLLLAPSARQESHTVVFDDSSIAYADAPYVPPPPDPLPPPQDPGWGWSQSSGDGAGDGGGDCP
ncbi:MAG: hypothetical protein HYS26_01380 [Candidatus Kaiserbacteria bacterium]|nr:MAG: hypothetical protein HYS26_01380 [Candidatus Kaiserbacteria bacterium]